MISLRTCLALSIVLLAPIPASAESINQLLPNLLNRLGISLGLPPSSSVPPELAAVQEATRVPFFRGPESPTASFAFRFDPAVGALVSTSEGLGSYYSQRPDTLGEGRVSLSMNYTRADFRELDGAKLDRLVLVLEGPITTKIDADISSDAIILGVTYGLLDNLDLAVAVPVIHNSVSIKGTMSADFLGVTSARTSRDATGLGDIIVSAKYRFYQNERFAAGALLELSLPTGDEDDLLGVGALTINPGLLASFKIGYGLVANASTVMRLSTDTGKVDHELFYTVGLAWNIASRVTVSVDLIGTHLIDNSRPALTQTSGFGVPARKSSDDILDIGLGFKAIVWRNVLLTGGVLIPLNTTGLRAKAIPSIGVEVPF